MSEPLRFNATVAVDLVVLTIVDNELKVLLVRPVGPAFKGKWALPGGFILEQESLIGAAARKLHDETGIRLHTSELTQIGAYGDDPARDTRGRVISVAYTAFVPHLPAPTAGTGTTDALLAPAYAAAGWDLAFDHEQLLKDGLKVAQVRFEEAPMALQFLPEEFTIAELREVYEAAWGTPLPAGNFQRNVAKYVRAAGKEGFMTKALDSQGNHKKTTAERTNGRPAHLYTHAPNPQLDPPLRRPVTTQNRETE